MSSTADSTSGFGETSRFVMFKFLAVVASKAVILKLRGVPP